MKGQFNNKMHESIAKLNKIFSDKIIDNCKNKKSLTNFIRGSRL